MSVAPRATLERMQNDENHVANAMRMHLAGEIRAWLGRRNRSQSDMARHLGCNRSAISRRLGGAQDFTFVELTTIADWLGITLADLLGPEILQTRRSPHTDLVGAGASRGGSDSRQLPRLDSNQ